MPGIMALRKKAKVGISVVTVLEFYSEAGEIQ